MSFLEILLVGVGLSMDAVAVCITNRMVFRSATRRQLLAMPLFFGVFQGLMPALGFFAGNLFSQFISRFSGPLILVILGTIGGKMIYDGFHQESGQTGVNTIFTYRLLTLQAVATSIDAFAVGVGFGALQVAVLPAVLTIGCTTFVLSLGALLLGKKFGELLGAKAHLFGGAVLVLLGVKALFG